MVPGGLHPPGAEDAQLGQWLALIGRLWETGDGDPRSKPSVSRLTSDRLWDDGKRTRSQGGMLVHRPTPNLSGTVTPREGVEGDGSLDITETHHDNCTGRSPTRLEWKNNEGGPGPTRRPPVSLRQTVFCHGVLTTPFQSEGRIRDVKRERESTRGHYEGVRGHHSKDLGRNRDTEGLGERSNHQRKLLPHRSLPYLGFLNHLWSTKTRS